MGIKPINNAISWYDILLLPFKKIAVGKQFIKPLYVVIGRLKEDKVSFPPLFSPTD